jgi:hypothetical protein
MILFGLIFFFLCFSSIVLSIVIISISINCFSSFDIKSFNSISVPYSGSELVFNSDLISSLISNSSIDSN